MKTIQKTIIGLALIATSIPALATSLHPDSFTPQVTCRLHYSKADIREVSEELNILRYGYDSVKIRGFELQAQLRQICAADGGPCTSTYVLSTVISKNGISSRVNHDIKTPVAKYTRVDQALEFANEEAEMVCDVE